MKELLSFYQYWYLKAISRELSPMVNKEGIKTEMVQYFYENYYLGKRKLYESETDVDIKSQLEEWHSFKVEKKKYRVDYVNYDNSVVVSNGTIRTLIYPEEYEAENDLSLKKGDTVFFKQVLQKWEEPYLYISNNGNLDEEPKEKVRFYINNRPKHVKVTLSLILDLLKVFEKPYHIKVFTNSEFYDRADNMVLYLNKRHTNVFYALLSKSLLVQSNYLVDRIPLLTKKLFAGIAFAENPEDSTKSFGTYLSTIIADITLECLTHSIKPESFLEYSHLYLLKSGISLNRIFLHSRSSYPYSFI